MRRRGRVKVVTPDWVMECLDAGQLLDETRYHPRLLQFTVQTPAPVEEPTPMDTTPTDTTPQPRTAHLVRSSSAAPTGSKTPQYNYHPHSPKTNSRTKEALARMVTHRIGQTSPGPGSSPERLAHSPGSAGGSGSMQPSLPPPPPPQSSLPPPNMPVPGGHMMRPMMPGAVGAGMRSPRGMLRNITNGGEPRMPRSPRVSRPRGPRSPRGSRGGRGGGAAKVSVDHCHGFPFIASPCSILSVKFLA